MLDIWDEWYNIWNYSRNRPLKFLNVFKDQPVYVEIILTDTTSYYKCMEYPSFVSSGVIHFTDID